MPIVLHAAVVDEDVLLWGETSPVAEVVAIPKPRGRPPRVPRPRTSPFDVGADGLARALKESGFDRKSTVREVSTGIAWLPTADGVPIPSSPLVAEVTRSGVAPEIRAWTVTAVRLTRDQTVELLCGCMGKSVLAPGILIGADLSFWCDAIKFAGSLVVRQRYLPGVEMVEDLARAVWEPVFEGADAGYLALLADRMPHVARAVTPDAAEVPTVHARTVLTTFLTVVLDHLVRSSEPAPAPSVRSTRSSRPRIFESIHDQWMYALRSKDGTMDGDPEEIGQLIAQVREWRRPFAVSAGSPYRLCFRLEEPPEVMVEQITGRPPTHEGTWFVRYLLQRRDDLSLLVPVGDLWGSTKSQAASIMGDAKGIREHVLRSLGQASGICSRIEKSLGKAHPEGYSLDAAGAHEFLTERSSALEQSGFGVMLPAWWTRKGTKVRLALSAHVKSPKMQGSGVGLGDIVEFDWEVSLGDEKISFEELQALARLKEPLVSVRGQWVQLDADEIRAAIDFWKKRAAGKATVQQVVRMAIGAEDRVQGFKFGGVTATGWVGDLLDRLGGQTAFGETEVPAGFNGTLRPYQVRGYSWLAFLRQWGLGACLADDMGLGKTPQALTLIERDWQPGTGHPVLIVCPTSVVNNWRKEAARFTPRLPVMVHHGIGRKKGGEFKAEAEKHAIVVSTYALLHRDHEHIKDIQWAGVILDEAQNIKNPETKQARAARAIHADYRMALTGTPVENNVGDLWSIMEFLNPGFLGSQSEFKRRFFVPIQAGRDADAAARLRRITTPFILRRLKTDKSIITDLPEKMEMKVFCTLTKEQASLYAAVLRDMENAMDGAEGIQRKGVILATLSKLKQVCNHPAQFLGDNSEITGRSGKLARLTEMLEEVIGAGDRALVFSQFAEMGELLRRHLQDTYGREVLFLHGGVSKKLRDEYVDRFQSDSGPQIFLLSLKAGGTGLNLTRASHVFHFDRWWNPAVENPDLLT